MNRRADRPVIAALGWRPPLWLLDYGPVALAVLVGLPALRVASRATSGSVAVLALALAVSAAALVLRHRAPLAVLVVLLIIALAIDYQAIVVLPVLLAVFTVAEYTDRAKVIGAALLAGSALTLAEYVHGSHQALPAAIIPRFVAVGLAVALGLYLRARADFVNGLHERANRLERERELLADKSVADERVRIARELHDVVAHNVSLMVVQAQALAVTGEHEAEQRAALGRVADLGRDALSEMHRMLGVLRLHDGAAPEREPQPGVDDLDTLVARTREAGLDAELQVEGPARRLPAGVETSIYRIVQEALTNVVRHASANHAVVTLTYSQDALEVTVLDDGVGPDVGAGNGSDAGHGLVGMRERVALFGGELETGARHNGDGYRVRAWLPVR